MFLSFLSGGSRFGVPSLSVNLLSSPAAPSDIMRTFPGGGMSDYCYPFRC